MIWRVVKWVLFGLLALVALPLVLLVIIFMTIPVRYKVEAATGRADGNRVFVRITYLFGLIRATYRDDTVKFRIFGIPIGRKKTQQPDAEEKAGKKPSGLLKFASKKTPKKEPAKPDKPKIPLKKRLSGIMDNIAAVWNYPNKKDIASAVKKMCIKQWGILRPKKLNISGEVGFADPSRTGFFFAGYGVVTEFLNIRKHVQLHGNFDTDRTVVALDVFAKGSINAARMMFVLLGFACKKPIRKLIKDIINLREDD